MTVIRAAAPSFGLHRLVRRHRHLAMMVLALALVFKALVPTGFMPDNAAGALSVRICNGDMAPADQARLTLPIAHDKQDKGAKADSACPFGALGHAAFGGVDPILLALAMVYAIAIGLAPRVARAIPARVRLLPPLRGPPALI